MKGGSWLAAWSVSDLLVPVPPARARRWLGVIAVAACAVVLALCLRGLHAIDPHFTPLSGAGGLAYVYTLGAAAVVGGMLCRQQLIAAPAMLLVPATSSAVVAAVAAVVLGTPAWIISLLALELATLLLAARIWGLFTSRRELRPWLPVALGAYYAALIAAAQPLSTALQTLAMNTEHGA